MTSKKIFRGAAEVEQLEERRLLSSNVFLSGGVLFIRGDDGRDNVFVSRSFDGEKIRVSMNGDTNRFRRSDVQSINIRVFGGDDRVEISSALDEPANIRGGYGQDVLIGGSGDDTINGGNGDDVIYGGSGHNRLVGQAGDDTLSGGDDRETLIGEAGDDVLHGGSGDDLLDGGDGKDTLYGDSGRDTLMGGNDDDFIFAVDIQKDYVDGGDGDDTLYVDSQKDDYRGGPGDDKIIKTPFFFF